MGGLVVVKIKKYEAIMKSGIGFADEGVGGDRRGIEWEELKFG